CFSCLHPPPIEVYPLSLHDALPIYAAVADEFAYVLDGEFTVVTKGKGKQVFRRGEIEYAARRTIHYSLNESKKPARVLVVLLKRSEEHTSELQSRFDLVCRLLLEKK